MGRHPNLKPHLSADWPGGLARGDSVKTPEEIL
jgi:hypothetical protein